MWITIGTHFLAFYGGMSVLALFIIGGRAS